jgi:hypothetical protein
VRGLPVGASPEDALRQWRTTRYEARDELPGGTTSRRGARRARGRSPVAGNDGLRKEGFQVDQVL